MKRASSCGSSRKVVSAIYVASKGRGSNLPHERDYLFEHFKRPSGSLLDVYITRHRRSKVANSCYFQHFWPRSPPRQQGHKVKTGAAVSPRSRYRRDSGSGKGSRLPFANETPGLLLRFLVDVFQHQVGLKLQHLEETLEEARSDLGTSFFLLLCFAIN